VDAGEEMRMWEWEGCNEAGMTSVCTCVRVRVRASNRA